MARYEVRYGTPVNFKIVKTESLEQAERMFDTARWFAENHNLNWTVALWNDGYLEKASRSTPPDDGCMVAAETPERVSREPTANKKWEEMKP